MNEQYGLYQTLTVTPIPKKDLTVKQKSTLKEKLNEADEMQGEAILMLIFEHAKIHNEFVYDPETKEAPYIGKRDKTDISFQLGKFPRDLRWILWRFFDFLTEDAE